MSTYSIRPTYV